MPLANKSVLFLLALAVAAGALAQDAPGGVRLLVQSAPLAGFRYHAAEEVWHELRVGDPLRLEREPDNPHDANAIAVTWRGRKLGYVPRRDNAALAWGLDRGAPLQARISRLAPHPNPARRIEFEVFVE
jgi:HIRAN domain-containing protein